MKRIHRLQTIAVTSFMALALISTATFAQSNGTAAKGVGQGQSQTAQQRHRRGARARRLLQGLVLKKLNLTEEQKAQAKQIRLGHRETLTALRKDIRAKRREIHQSLQGGAFNEALVRGKLTEIAGLRTKMMAERHQMRQQLLAILTPEQKTTLDRIRQEFKARQAARRAAGV